MTIQRKPTFKEVLQLREVIVDANHATIYNGETHACGQYDEMRTFIKKVATMKKHTPAYKAAIQIVEMYNDDIFSTEQEIENIIEEKTHASEMLAFIEKVAAWNFTTDGFKTTDISKAQAEAFVLIKKVRG